MDDLFRRPAENAARRAALAREEKLAQARESLEARNRDPAAYIAAARLCKQAGRLQETLDILGRGIGRCDPSAPLYEYYIERLEKCNRTEAAIAMAQEAARLFPEDPIFQVREALLLPVFYDSTEEIGRYRRRFTEGLHRLIRQVPLDTPLARKRAEAAIARNTNKYLHYQGHNDRDLQSLYGSWVERIMTANYPELAEPLGMPSAAGKIRVGYLSALSARFLNLSVAKFFGGWIREQDRRKFDVFAYHADRRADPDAEQVRRWGIPFRQLPGDVPEIAQAIRADRLHVLVFLDCGVHPRMAQLAALRLAPIQCAAWDIPSTSGIPAMDYFLSSGLAEPEDGRDHYSEKLVPLPGIGACFSKPVIPTVILTKTRRDFGLREDAVIFLSCQTVFKYLPEQDALIVRIAQRVPGSQFVFLATNELLEGDFRKRIGRAFAAAGLHAGDYCLWLPEMPLTEYWNLHLAGDVCLDTLAWSGGVSTLELIACGLPIVTLPGTLMRGRQSLAALMQSGVTETIAQDPAAYVEIAVRLGLDREWRKGIVQRMAEGRSRLFDDTKPVASLEQFYENAVAEGVRERQARPINQRGAG